jgi:hypothetical protein
MDKVDVDVEMDEVDVNVVPGRRRSPGTST